MRTRCRQVILKESLEYQDLFCECGARHAGHGTPCPYEMQQRVIFWLMDTNRTRSGREFLDTVKTDGKNAVSTQNIQVVCRDRLYSFRCLTTKGNNIVLSQAAGMARHAPTKRNNIMHDVNSAFCGRCA